MTRQLKNDLKTIASILYTIFASFLLLWLSNKYGWVAFICCAFAAGSILYTFYRVASSKKTE